MNPRSEDYRSINDSELIEAMFAGCGYNSLELNESIEAERDVLGLTRKGATVIKPESAAIQGLIDAIAVLPNEQRAAYDQAVLTAPRLVEMETPSDKYLRACEYDFWAAAKKLCAYWQYRLEIFGSRYNLPMDLSGEGALREEEVDLFKRGVAFVGPVDGFGRAVFTFERENFEADWIDPGDVKLKVIFYMLHVLAEQEAAVSNGFVAIIACETEKHAKSAPDGKPMKLVKSEIIPVRIRAMHLISFGASSTTGRALNLMLSFMKTWSFLHFRVRMHTFETNGTILSDFGEYGLSSIHLPERAGGSVDPKKWAEERIEIDKKRYASFHSHTKVDACANGQDPATIVEQARLDTQKKLKRRLDELRELSEEYSNERELARLEAEVSDLAKKNGKLRMDHGYLQVLQRLGSFVVNDYDKDRLCIRNIVILALAKVVTETPGILPCYRDNNCLLPSVTEWFLTHRLVFAGRDSSTNELIFSREDDDVPGEERLIRVNPGAEIPGLSAFLERLRLGLQGKLPCQLLGIDDTEDTLGGDSRGKESTRCAQDKHRRQERAKRVKLLKRL